MCFITVYLTRIAVSLWIWMCTIIYTHCLLCVCVRWQSQGKTGVAWRGGTATVPVSLHQPTISPCVGSDKPRMKALFVGRVTLFISPPASPSHKAKDAHMTCAHNYIATLRSWYAYLHTLYTFMYRTEGKSHRVHPFISFMACFPLLWLCKNVIQAVSTWQRDLSVVISLELITILGRVAWPRW